MENPGGGASVPGFGADQNQNNRLLSIQYIHIFGPRTVNEARAGYSLIRTNAIGENPIKDSDVGIKRNCMNVDPGAEVVSAPNEVQILKELVVSLSALRSLRRASA